MSPGCRLGGLALKFYPRREDYSLCTGPRKHVYSAQQNRRQPRGLPSPNPPQRHRHLPHRALVEAVATGAPGRLSSGPGRSTVPGFIQRAVLKYYVIRRVREALTGAQPYRVFRPLLAKGWPWGAKPRHAGHCVHGPLGDRLTVAPALRGDSGRRAGRMGHAVRGTRPGSRHTQL